MNSCLFFKNGIWNYIGDLILKMYKYSCLKMGNISEWMIGNTIIIHSHSYSNENTFPLIIISERLKISHVIHIFCRIDFACLQQFWNVSRIIRGGTTTLTPHFSKAKKQNDIKYLKCHLTFCTPHDFNLVKCHQQNIYSIWIRSLNYMAYSPLDF